MFDTIYSSLDSHTELLHLHPHQLILRDILYLSCNQLLISPQNESYGNHNSYRLIDNELFIVATGQPKHYDNVDRHLDTTGTGFRSAIAGNLVNKFTASAKGVTEIPPKRNLIKV